METLTDQALGFNLLSHEPVNVSLQGLYIGGSLDTTRVGFSGTINSGLLVQVLAITIIYLFDKHGNHYSLSH